MPAFLYSARPAIGGDIQSGEIELKTKDEVLSYLHKQKLIPVSVREKPKQLSFKIGTGISTKDIVIFTRQFSTMIDAGLPLVQGLGILAEQTENKTFRNILKQISRDVEGGSTLAEAMQKHPKVFDDLFVNLVAAGEVGGILDTILRRLATFIEKAEKLKSQIKGAMTYPIVVMAIAIIVIAVILIFVIPVFEDMFASFGQALPVPTQIVVNMSRFMKGNIHWIILALIAVVFAFKRFRDTKKGRKITDELFLKLPIFGDLLKKTAVARFTRTLGTMISSGVPILDSLEIVAKTSGNVVLEEIIFEVRGSIAEGQTIAEPLSENDVFPGMVVQMISVGEATGALDSMLEKIADFYDDEVDAAVAALTSMLEPLLMLFLGGSIGGLVVAMYLPIFSMAGAVGG